MENLEALACGGGKQRAHCLFSDPQQVDMDMLERSPKLKDLYEYHRPFYARMNAFCR